jgi:hypothetical protein
VRPKMMTVCAIMAGLLPIMWSHGTGAEVMQRIAVPMIGGMVSSRASSRRGRCKCAARKEPNSVKGPKWLKRPEWLGGLARYEIRQAQKGTAADRSTDETSGRPEQTTGTSQTRKNSVSVRAMATLLTLIVIPAIYAVVKRR